MTSLYPDALDSLPNPVPGTARNADGDLAHDKQHSNANDALEAVQLTLGTNPEGDHATVAARLDAIEETLTAPTVAEVQAAYDAIPATGGTLRLVGEIDLGSTTLLFGGLKNNVVVEAGGATFLYSGTGRAIDINCHRSRFNIGKVEATGAALTSSTAIGIYWRSFWGQLDAWVLNFKAGTAVAGETANSNRFPFLRIQNCKIGLSTASSDMGHNTFGVFDFRIDGSSGVTDPIAMKVTGTAGSAVGFAGCTFDRFNCVYNHNSGSWTLIQVEDFWWELTIEDLTFECLSPGETIVADLNLVTGTVVGALWVTNYHPSQTAGGTSVVTGSGVNMRHPSAGKNMLPERVFDPQALADFTGYNCTLSLDAADGRQVDRSLKLTSPSLVTAPQVTVLETLTHPAPGSAVTISFAVKSNRIGAKFYPWLNTYTKASVQLQGNQGPMFKVPAADTWYFVTVITEYPVPLTAAKGHLQFTVDIPSIIGSTEFKFSELGVYVDEARPVLGDGQLSRPAGVNDDYVLRMKLVADTQYRFQIGHRFQGDPYLLWGPGGSTAPDVRLRRSNTKELTLDDNAGGAVQILMPGSLYVDDLGGGEYTLKVDHTTGRVTIGGGGSTALFTVGQRSTTHMELLFGSDSLYLRGKHSTAGSTLTGTQANMNWTATDWNAGATRDLGGSIAFRGDGAGSGFFIWDAPGNQMMHLLPEGTIELWQNTKQDAVQVRKNGEANDSAVFAHDGIKFGPGTAVLDVAFMRTAAGIVALTNASTGGAAMEMTEISDASAPAANKSRLYTRDNGSGKTQLVVRFPTGAIQVVATEP